MRERCGKRLRPCASRRRAVARAGPGTCRRPPWVKLKMTACVWSCGSPERDEWCWKVAAMSLAAMTSISLSESGRWRVQEQCSLTMRSRAERTASSCAFASLVRSCPLAIAHTAETVLSAEKVRSKAAVRVSVPAFWVSLCLSLGRKSSGGLRGMEAAVKRVEGVGQNLVPVLQAEHAVGVVPDAVRLFAGQVVFAGRAMGGLGFDVVAGAFRGAGDLSEGSDHGGLASGAAV